MGWFKEITKEEAKQRYCNYEEVLICNKERFYWQMTSPGAYSSHAPIEELFHRSIPTGEGENKFYKPMLTVAQKDRQRKLNAKNGWGLTYSMKWNLYNKHKAARKAGDEICMAEIEYRLTDANFHSLAGKLCSGDYKAARQEIKESLK